MNITELIEEIIASKTAVELLGDHSKWFGDLTEWKKKYRQYSSMIHPDVCKEPNAAEAFTKLNSYKEELDRGKKHEDDAGVVSYAMRTVEVIGEEIMLKKSFDTYNTLMAFNDKASVAFKRYLPVSAKMISANELEFTLIDRSVPLSSLGITEQVHVNWILSRMLEFTGWLSEMGYCHAGFNPDSIYITPENHGMVCISFYHMTKIGESLKTISGKYSSLYPTHVFQSKVATLDLDIELAKRTAIYLLGDHSGTGTKLKKTHNEDVLNFLQRSDSIPYDTYNTYRDMLRKNFDTKQFHKLII